MDAIKSNNVNEKAQLKTFMAKIRSGNLVRLIESNQLQYEEKCTYLSQKLKKSEEEMRRKLLILQQNSHLIEKFQMQLQELSDQNTELLGQQQVFKEENENLNAQLQSSEAEFAQLDILYDQQVSDLSVRNNELEQNLANLKCTQEICIGQFDKTQKDFNEMLTKAEQRNSDLLNELANLDLKKKIENEELKNKLYELNDVLNQKTIDYEERIQELQTSVSSALDGNKEKYDLENQIEKLKNERKALDNEKSQAVTANDEMKVVVEDLKKKLCTKEKELEEFYLKFKQIARLGTPNAPSVSMKSANFSIRKHRSSDEPTPLFEDSTDSDASSVSFYKSPKNRRVSTDHDKKLESKRTSLVKRNQLRGPSFGGFKKKMSKTFDDDIEIPESPIVSSSAFGNNDQRV